MAMPRSRTAAARNARASRSDSDGYGPRQLRPVPSLAGALAAQLTGEIQAGRLQAGDRLPTEHQMKDAFGVSRTVVREAIAALKADGLVTSRQGSGVFVAQDARHRTFRINPDRLTTNADLVQVMELRLCIELEAAALAARNAGKTALQELRRCLKRIADEIARGQPAVEEDFDFHCCIADATGNPLISRFLRFLGPFIIPRPLLRMRPQRQTQAYLAEVQAEHEAIYKAIVEGNPTAARRAMRHHLERGLALNRNAPQDAPLAERPPWPA